MRCTGKNLFLDNLLHLRLKGDLLSIDLKHEICEDKHKVVMSSHKQGFLIILLAPVESQMTNLN